MSATNIVAEGVESHGCRTFSAKEMAFNILALMHPLLFDVAQVEPVWADLNGGMDRLNDLADITTRIRTELNATADTRKKVSVDNAADFKVINGPEAEAIHKKVNITPRANFTLPVPKLKPTFDNDPELTKLRGMIDLEKVVVVAGYGEVGPFGSSRTRWQKEALGDFTIEGLLELATVTGLIKFVDGKLKSGKSYVGWVDAKTEEPVDDSQVKFKYEAQLREHTGIRWIEPDLFRGYDPKRKGFSQEIELNHDLEAIETSPADAEKFRHQHGDKVDVWVDGDRCFARFKKGAKIMVPKAISFDRLVAGQLPTGWDPKAFGIPDDIVSQVDRTTTWALVCVAEALSTPADSLVRHRAHTDPSRSDGWYYGCLRAVQVCPPQRGRDRSWFWYGRHGELVEDVQGSARREGCSEGYSARDLLEHACRMGQPSAQCVFSPSAPRSSLLTLDSSVILRTHQVPCRRMRHRDSICRHRLRHDSERQG